MIDVKKILMGIIGIVCLLLGTVCLLFGLCFMFFDENNGIKTMGLLFVNIAVFVLSIFTRLFDIIKEKFPIGKKYSYVLYLFA